MNREQEFQTLKEEYLNTPVPENGMGEMMQGIEAAKQEKNRKAICRRARMVGMSTAAVLAVLIILPNTSQSVAMAMEKIPVIGAIVKVVTVRDYNYKDDFHEAQVSIPKLEAEGDQTAVTEVNQEVEQYIDRLIAQFQEDIADNGESYQSLDISHEVVTDTDNWFTLKLSVLETRAGGYQYERYYHLNKTDGKIAELKDLFKEGSDYQGIINIQIQDQMRAQMEKDETVFYWLNEPEGMADNFKSIAADQNFYLSKAGDIVIVFDEYQVAPGSMGTPEFTIPKESLTEMLR